LTASPVFNIGLNNTLLIDDFLEVMQEKIIIGVKLVARNMLPGKVCPRQNASVYQMVSAPVIFSAS
jgi:hypothetical protein